LTFEVELELLGLVLGSAIEIAELLDEKAVARRAAVGDHDVVDRCFWCRRGETDFQGHWFPSFKS
jgi:hypothetical protein